MTNQPMEDPDTPPVIPDDDPHSTSASLIFCGTTGTIGGAAALFTALGIGNTGLAILLLFVGACALIAGGICWWIWFDDQRGNVEGQHLDLDVEDWQRWKH